MLVAQSTIQSFLLRARRLYFRFMSNFNKNTPKYGNPVSLEHDAAHRYRAFQTYLNGQQLNEGNHMYHVSSQDTTAVASERGQYVDGFYIAASRETGQAATLAHQEPSYIPQRAASQQSHIFDKIYSEPKLAGDGKSQEMRRFNIGDCFNQHRSWGNDPGGSYQEQYAGQLGRQSRYRNSMSAEYMHDDERSHSDGFHSIDRFDHNSPAFQGNQGPREDYNLRQVYTSAPYTKCPDTETEPNRFVNGTSAHTTNSRWHTSVQYQNPPNQRAREYRSEARLPNQPPHSSAYAGAPSGVEGTHPSHNEYEHNMQAVQPQPLCRSVEAVTQPYQPSPTTWVLRTGSALKRGAQLMHALGKSGRSTAAAVLATPIGTCVRFAPGEAAFVVGGDRTTQIYNIDGRRVMSDMPTPGSASECFTRSCCFTPSGKHVLVGSEDACIRLWSHERRMIVHEFRGHNVDVACMDSCRNAWPQFVSGSADATTRTWDANTGKCVTSHLSPDGSSIAAVAMEPRGHVYGVATAQGMIALYDVRMAGVSGRCEGHTGGVFSLAFAPNGSMASASVDGTVRRWQGTYATTASREHTGMVLACTFSDDGAWLVSGGADGVVRFHEPSTLDCVWELTGDPSFGPVVDVSMAGRFVAIANGSDQARLFEVALQQLRGP
eukprot:m.208401 g.208401  ORF g.208401 m.208401 type:complete len:660 (+) comp18965_c0_seq2:322-2301(+)